MLISLENFYILKKLKVTNYVGVAEVENSELLFFTKEGSTGVLCVAFFS